MPWVSVSDKIACTVDSYLMRNLSLRLVPCFVRAGHILANDGQWFYQGGGLQTIWRQDQFWIKLNYSSLCPYLKPCKIHPNMYIKPLIGPVVPVLQYMSVNYLILRTVHIFKCWLIPNFLPMLEYAEVPRIVRKRIYKNKNMWLQDLHAMTTKKKSGQCTKPC